MSAKPSKLALKLERICVLASEELETVQGGLPTGPRFGTIFGRIRQLFTGPRMGTTAGRKPPELPTGPKLGTNEGR